SLIHSHFETLLRSFITTPDLKLSSLEYLTAASQHEQLELFNATKMSYDLESTLVSLFKSQVLDVQEGIAVGYEEEILNYKEVDVLEHRGGHYSRPDNNVG
ncbi:hypothetical protein CSC81_17090, partial [Tenacibaculum discolor]